MKRLVTEVECTIPILVSEACTDQCYIAKTGIRFNDIYILNKLEDTKYCWSSLAETECWATGSFDSFEEALADGLNDGWHIVECSTREDVIKFLHK